MTDILKPIVSSEDYDLQETKEIAVLMSTYNGSEYLTDQIESLLNSTYTNWRLYIRDDGSTDITTDIIRKYEKLDRRIILISDNVAHRGVKGSFLYLLKSARADYYMFCDQDDVWVPEKMEVLVHELSRNELEYPAKPCLVVSDLEIVDENLSTIHPSMWKFLGINRLVRDSRYLKVAPMYAGCSMMFNEAAKMSALTGADSDFIIHDQLIALNVYRSGGLISAVEQPLVRYRQHGRNEIGASSNRQGWNPVRIIGKIVKESIYYYQATRPVLNTSAMDYVYWKIKRILN